MTRHCRHMVGTKPDPTSERFNRQCFSSPKLVNSVYLIRIKFAMCEDLSLVSKVQFLWAFGNLMWHRVWIREHLKVRSRLRLLFDEHWTVVPLMEFWLSRHCWKSCILTISRDCLKYMDQWFRPSRALRDGWKYCLLIILDQPHIVLI
jgi:hypothetical protein